jgi:hypothetical protein
MRYVYVLGLQPRKKRAGLPLPARAAGPILFLPASLCRNAAGSAQGLEGIKVNFILQLKRKGIPAPAVVFADY